MQDRAVGVTAQAQAFPPVRLHRERDGSMQITPARSDETVGFICVDERCTVVEALSMHRSTDSRDQAAGASLPTMTMASTPVGTEPGVTSPYPSVV